MADRFWVGGTGNWSDYTNHWSDSSGGSPGASLPTSTDNVYFDANSFSAIEQVVTIDTTANCLDMDWTGVLYSPTLTDTNKMFLIYGSLTFITGMSDTRTGMMFLYATDVGKTITTNGVTITGSLLEINGDGSWTLQDNFTTTSTISFKKGTFITNNKNITLLSNAYFGTTYGDTKQLTLGSSVVTASYFNLNNSALTMTCGTSTLIQTGTSIFAGGGKIYNNVELQNTCTITGSNTFNNLKLFAGKTYSITSGTTQTVKTLIADGTILQSSSSGTPFTIKQDDGWCNVKEASIKDCTVSGEALFNAIKCTNVSGNTGWNFVDTIKLAHFAPATKDMAGLMSAKDKIKFDGLSTNASDITLTDSGSLITADNVEDALQEIVTNFNAEKADYTHKVSKIYAYKNLGGGL